MRISTQSHSALMLRHSSANEASLNKVMTQIYTQKRIQVPSDDPVASTRLVQLKREQAALNQYESNITRLSGNLDIQESYIKSFGDSLFVLNDKLLEANNASHAQADMQGYGTEIQSVVEGIIAGMNAQNEDGHYLFGGTKDNQPPVVFNEKTQRYEYQGNSDSRSTMVANGIDMTETTHVVGAFSSEGTTDLALLNDLLAISQKMQDPGQDLTAYQDDISKLIEQTQDTIGKNAALLTDLGGRQNRLTMMSDTHEGVKIANQTVIDELEVMNPAEAYIELGNHLQAIQASNSAYMQISKLSLFDLI